MDVIELKRPDYNAYSFVKGGSSVVHEWFAGLPDVEWGAFLALLDIYEAGGIDAIRATVIDLENGFFGLLTVRHGGDLPCPIFRKGPFDEETEITFLAGARWDPKLKRVRPFSATGEAEENLELLLKDRTKRRRL